MPSHPFTLAPPMPPRLSNSHPFPPSTHDTPRSPKPTPPAPNPCPTQAVSSGLGQQRAVFEGIGSKMSSLGAKFPVVNTLLNAVRRRKNRVRMQLSCSCFLRHRLEGCSGQVEMPVGALGWEVLPVLLHAVLSRCMEQGNRPRPPSTACWRPHACLANQLSPCIDSATPPSPRPQPHPHLTPPHPTPPWLVLQDNLILAAVVAACTLFILVYWWNK